MRALSPLILLAVVLSGCRSPGLPFPWPGASGGSLRVESLGEQGSLLAGRFRTAVYAVGPVETSFFLADAPIERILDGTMQNGQIVHIELLWTPKAGETPIEDTATNASIRYIIFSEGEVGIYGGAGFARVRGGPGDTTVGLTVRDASLRLLESTDGFADLLTPARLTGAFNARLNAHQTRQIQYAVSQRVTNKLGRSRIVDAEETKPTDWNPWASVMR